MKYLIVVDMQVDFINGSLGSELATAIMIIECRNAKRRFVKPILSALA